MSVNNLAATRASAGIRTGARKWQISVKVHYQRHLLQNESATCAIIKSAKQRGQHRLDKETITANVVSWNEIIHWELEIVCLGHCQDSCEMPKDSLFMT